MPIFSSVLPHHNLITSKYFLILLPTCLLGLTEDDGNDGIGGHAEDEDERQVDTRELVDIVR